jgi:hypothetical protein
MVGRLGRERLCRLRVVLNRQCEVPLSELEPAVLRPEFSCTQEPLCPAVPAGSHCRLTASVHVVLRQSEGHTSGAASLSACPMEMEGPVRGHRTPRPCHRATTPPCRVPPAPRQSHLARGSPRSSVELAATSPAPAPPAHSSKRSLPPRSNISPVAAAPRLRLKPLNDTRAHRSMCPALFEHEWATYPGRFPSTHTTCGASSADRSVRTSVKPASDSMRSTSPGS